MKRIVDGVEVEFTDSPEATIERLSDRLIVRTPEGARTAVAIRSGEQTLVSYKGRQYAVGGKTSRARQSTAGSGEIKAPMPGLIVDVFVAEGDELEGPPEIASGWSMGASPGGYTGRRPCTPNATGG